MAEASRLRQSTIDATLRRNASQVGLAGVTAGKADLRDPVVARHDPADVAARELAVEKAVQPIVVEAANAFVFRFHADQEFAIGAEAAIPRHARARAVGADGTYASRGIDPRSRRRRGRSEGARRRAPPRARAIA